MKKPLAALFAVSILVMSALGATISHAQPLSQTFYVSKSGSGSTCSRSAPCNSLNLAAVAPAGNRIVCLDEVTDFQIRIEKPVTIDCSDTGASISSDFIAVDIEMDEATYPNGVVTLRGLSISGFTQRNVGLDGIEVKGGGAAVIIEDCTISDISGTGIVFTPISSLNLFVRNTHIANSQGGVSIRLGSGTTVRASLSNVQLDSNTSYGLRALDGALVDVSDSVASNSEVGFFAASLNRGVDIMLYDVIVSHNQRGVVGAGANGSVRIGNSLLTGNNLAMDGNVISLGGNSATDNRSNGTVKSTIAKF